MALTTTRDADRRPRQPAERYLRLEVAGDEGSFDWHGATCTIGSADSAHLTVSDGFVSKRHCELAWSDAGELWLNDLESRNGTYVNGTRVGRCQVLPGACISVGRTRLTLLPPRTSNTHGIIGEHASVRSVIGRVARLAPTMHPVLVLGETGTGKELVARALHEGSAVSVGPFEPLNCAAIPPQLAESQLFGHVRGAFTGAERARDGAFVRADGGTLFLDEIGEMPLELQPKLLRVLEDGCVRPVGGGEVRRVRVRVVAATHRRLSRDARVGRFRLDLFHRIAVGTVDLPALRERRSDIPLLARHFLRRVGSAAGLSEAAEYALMRHNWPGNVRALRHAIERASLLGGATLEPADFDLDGEGSASANHSTGSARRADYVRVRGLSMGEIRRAVYLRALAETGGNRSRASLLLGVPKSTFFDQLRALGLDAQSIEHEMVVLGLRR